MRNVVAEKERHRRTVVRVKRARLETQQEARAVEQTLAHNQQLQARDRRLRSWLDALERAKSAAVAAVAGSNNNNDDDDGDGAPPLAASELRPMTRAEQARRRPAQAALDAALDAQRALVTLDALTSTTRVLDDALTRVASNK